MRRRKNNSLQSTVIWFCCLHYYLIQEYVKVIFYFLPSKQSESLKTKCPDEKFITSKRKANPALAHEKTFCMNEMRQKLHKLYWFIWVMKISTPQFIYQAGFNRELISRHQREHTITKYQTVVSKHSQRYLPLCIPYLDFSPLEFSYANFPNESLQFV